MTSKDRLKEFLSFNKIGRNRFEEKIGVAYGYMSSKSKTITSDVIENLSKEYPTINLIWLITGEGEMINTTNREYSDVNIDTGVGEMTKKSEEETSDNLNNNEMEETYKIALKVMAKELKELEKENAELRGRLELNERAIG
jgi:hypothetical protein